ncbi:MAG: GGDEF domain-containing protein [Wenzhouxiangella sp.]
MTDKQTHQTPRSVPAKDLSEPGERDQQKQKIRVRRLSLASMGWSIAIAVTTITWWLGLLDVSAFQLMSLFVLIVLALSGLYLSIRKNWNLRFADPSLTVPHLLFGAVVGLLVISQADEARPVLLLLYVMVMLYGLFGLKAGDYLALAILASGGLGMIVIWELTSGQTHRDSQLIVMEWLVFTAVMGWMAFIGSYVSQLRWNLNQRNRDLREISNRLKYLSEHDELTQIPNRRRLLEQLEQRLDSAQRHGVTFSVAMLDLDHFKQVNDSHGHGVGDEVLEQFAIRVGECLRNGDFCGRMEDDMAAIGRLGGEEFLAILPKTHQRDALAVARRLLERIRAAPFTTAAGPVNCTASAGVAEFQPGESLQNLLSRADEALYRAKSNGRDQAASARLTQNPRK